MDLQAAANGGKAAVKTAPPASLAKSTKSAAEWQAVAPAPAAEKKRRRKKGKGVRPSCADSFSCVKISSALSHHALGCLHQSAHHPVV